MRNFLLFVVFIISNLGFAQNPFYTVIDKTASLPSNSVFDIFQDSKGFMWFATGKGLCRYDGINFRTFTSDFQTSKSGSCIQEDKYGRIWYENFDGFLNYVENGVLKSLPQKTSLGYFRYGIVNNVLFLIQPDGVYVYDLKTLKFTRKHLISDKKIKFCFATADEFYVLGDYFYEFKDNKNFSKIKLPLSFEDDIKGPIINYWNKKIIINSKSNANYYVFENGKFYKFSLKNSIEFIQNTAVTDNSLWICAPNGVYQNNLISKTTTNYFQGQNVSYVFKDKHNHFWISTLDNGLLFVQDFSNNYINLPYKPVSLALGKNEVFIGAAKDLVYKLKFDNLEISKIFETSNNHAVNEIFADTINNNLYFNSFKFNVLDSNHRLISDYKIAIKDIKKVDDKYFSFAASGVSGIFYVNKNLISKWDNIFDKNKKETFSGFNQSFLLNNSNGKSTEYNNYNNTIYYATNNGLQAITAEGIVKEIKYNNETLFLIRLQKYQNFVVGLSASEKLYSISATNKVSMFGLPAIIASEKFNKFFIRSHYCYLFSPSSIFEYDFNTKNIQKIMSLGTDIEATDVILKNNQLLFATSKGIVIKNREKIGIYPKPKLIIDGIFVNNKQVKNSKLKELNANENDVTINLSVISFLPNVSYAVSYKINKSDWKTLESNDKNLKLSALAAGNYNITFAVIYNSKKVDFQSVQFEIRKPFYLHPLFLLGIVLLIVLGFYFFYKWQLKKINIQNQLQFERINLENKLNQSKLIAIKSQMNPHFFYNALNTIQSYILSNDKKQAVSYLSKFSNLTRTILEMTEKESISVADEVETLRLYLDIEKARFEDDFEYFIEVENSVALEQQKIPAMLLQPFVENAVKHGLLHKNGEKKLSILFKNYHETIIIEIADNGIGRQKSAELNAIKNRNHNSFATNAIKNRVDLLNKNKVQKITINFVDKINQSNQSIGTTVVIEIPTN